VRGNNFGDTTVVNFNLGGSATNGVDYAAIVDSVIFYPGDTTIFVPIDAFYDGITEGNENIIISLQLTSVCGNITLQTVSIVINDVLPIAATASASLTNTTPCTPVVLTASATGGFGPYTYTWNNGDTTATQTVNPGQTTTYNVIVSDSCGTPIDTAFVTVTIDDPVPITVQVAPSDTVICEGSVTFTATGAGGITALSYSWSTGDSTQTITVTPTETTTYTVTVSDSCGSPVGIAEVTVTIKCELVVPNVFTPNGDGTNDFFVIANLELYPASKLYVYNRWGRKVYQSDDYKNNWAGDDMSEGVYYFVLDVPEKPEKLSGTVTILR
jgi:gliding motility-associated-like protein